MRFSTKLCQTGSIISRPGGIQCSPIFGNVLYINPAFRPATNPPEMIVTTISAVNARVRRGYVLGRMRDLDYISEAEYIEAMDVPMESKLQGIDSLLSMVQMPAGIPVATFAGGRAGAVNAALFDDRSRKMPGAAGIPVPSAVS